MTIDSERLLAAIGSFALHLTLLVSWALVRGGGAQPSPAEGTTIYVHFVDPSPIVPRFHEEVGRRGRIEGPEVRQNRTADAFTERVNGAEADNGAAPVIDHVPDDPALGAIDYEAAINSLPSSKAPVRRYNPLDRTPNRWQDRRPDRFKMQRPVTVEDVVRDFSRFMGLWPPGYTDSPCPMIRRTVEGLLGEPDVDPELAKDALAAKARYCD